MTLNHYLTPLQQCSNIPLAVQQCQGLCWAATQHLATTLHHTTQRLHSHSDHVSDNVVNGIKPLPRPLLYWTPTSLVQPHSLNPYTHSALKGTRHCANLSHSVWPAPPADTSWNRNDTAPINSCRGKEPNLMAPRPSTVTHSIHHAHSPLIPTPKIRQYHNYAIKGKLVNLPSS